MARSISEKVRIQIGANGTHLYYDEPALPGGGLAHNLNGWDGKDVTMLDRWGFHYTVPAEIVRQKLAEAKGAER